MAVDIDGTIERLMAIETLDDAHPPEPGLAELTELERKEQARREMSQELATEAPKDEAIRLIGERPRSMWTLQSLRARKLASADLYGDGTFTFTFDPKVLTSDWAQAIFAKAQAYFEARDARREATPEGADEGPDEALEELEGVTFASLYHEYGAIVYDTLRPGRWSFFEEVDDAEGNPVFREDGERALEPWPISRANVGKLSWEELQDFLTACFKSMRGEANGQG